MLAFVRALTWVLVFLLPPGAALLTACDPAPETTRVRRPVAARRPDIPLREDKIDPELETILREWEQACAGRNRLDARFTRYKYDHTFEVEKRATGSLAVDDWGRAVYRIVSANLAPGEQSSKQNRSGAPYRLQADDAERWHWTGKMVIRIDDQERTFKEIEFPRRSADGSFVPDPPALPEEMPNEGDELAAQERVAAEPEPASPALPQELPPPATTMTLRERLDAIVILSLFAVAALANDKPVSHDSMALGLDAFTEVFREFVLPRQFLLGTTAKDLKRRFHVRLVKQSDTEIRLEFRPREKRDQLGFDRFILILRRGTYAPMALKIVDVTGAESVHVFSDVRINADSAPKSSPNVYGEQLDRPNLHGLRRIQPPAVASPREGGLKL